MSDMTKLHTAILTGDAKTAKFITEQALAAGAKPFELVPDYTMPAMSEEGRHFECNRLFVPERLLSARAVKSALELIRPLLAASGAQSRGRVAIGTVKGDLHDIGKNLVGAMLGGRSYEVIDLGIDVTPEQFVAALKEKQANIVAMSALLTTTMPAMKTTIDAMKQAGVRQQVKVLVGGAPICQRYGEQIGTDGCSESATGAVTAAKRTMAQP